MVDRELNILFASENMSEQLGPLQVRWLGEHSYTLGGGGGGGGGRRDSIDVCGRCVSKMKLILVRVCVVN